MMTYSGAPKDGKSDVDRPFLPERQKQAKKAFDRAADTQPAKDTDRVARSSGGASKMPESIGKSAPGPALNMEGNRGVQQHFASERLSKEAAAERLKHDAAKVAAKKLAKSSQNRDNDREAADKAKDTGRE